MSRKARLSESSAWLGLKGRGVFLGLTGDFSKGVGGFQTHWEHREPAFTVFSQEQRPRPLQGPLVKPWSLRHGVTDLRRGGGTRHEHQSPLKSLPSHLPGNGPVTAAASHWLPLYSNLWNPGHLCTRMLGCDTPGFCVGKAGS